MVLYLKKLGAGIVYGLLLILIFAVIYSVAGSLIPGDGLGWGFSMWLSSLGLAKIISMRRNAHQDLQSRYLTGLAGRPFQFARDILYTVKHREFAADLWVFVTLALPFSALVALRDNELGPAENAIWAVVFFAFSVFVMTIYDILIWLFIHRKWSKHAIPGEDDSLPLS